MKFSVLAAVAALAMMPSAVSATVFLVDARANSSTGGTGVSTFAVDVGQEFKVSVASDDLWSAGALPRWSNADGLTGDLFATGSDESGAVLGTRIGRSFGAYSQGDLSAPFGSLVGRIGSSFQLLGTSFRGPAWGTGTLELFYWDSNPGDNIGSVSANVALVPEPASWALLIAGFGLVGAAARRRRQQTVLA